MSKSKKAGNRYKSDADFASYTGGEDFFEYYRDHAGQVAGRKRRDQVRRRPQHRLHGNDQESSYLERGESRAY